MDPAPAVRGLGFTVDDLGDEDFRLTREQYGIALSRLLALLKHPTLGLELGARATISSWGVVGLMLMLAQNSRDLFQLAIDFQHAAGRLVLLRGEEQDAHYCLVADPLFDERQLGRFLIDETYASFVQICRFVVGLHFNPREVEFMGERPHYGVDYEKVFRCPVSFRRSANRLHLPSEPYVIPSGDPILLRHVRGLLLERAGAQLDTPRSQLESSVLQGIRRNLAGPPSLAQIATSLHFTERTLRRRLDSLGLSYTEMLDQERRQRALNLLAHSSCSLFDVAQACGFSYERTLARAVKRWTGMSPAKVRKQARGSAVSP